MSSRWHANRYAYAFCYAHPYLHPYLHSDAASVLWGTGHTACPYFVPNSADVYSYSFTFFVEAGCQQAVTGPATLRFQVANDPLGPFTLFDEQTRTVTFPAGPATVTFTGTMTETAIPFPYEFYKIEFIALDLRGGATQSTGVSNLCQISTPVPTVSVTVTPTVTDTASSHHHPQPYCMSSAVHGCRSK